MTLQRPHILITDDDDRIRKLLVRFLGQNGYWVTSAADAAQARELLRLFRFDLAILDIMMPGESGLDLARYIRTTLDRLPVMLLTAMGETADRITGLEAGADDYLPKPFEPKELLLRINAILRRAGQNASVQAVQKGAMLQLGAWTFDATRRCLVDAGGTSVALTASEFSLIQALAERPGVPIRREALAHALGLSGSDRTIDVQVTRLRRKLGDDPKLPEIIQTVRGKGYLLVTR